MPQTDSLKEKNSSDIKGGICYGICFNPHHSAITLSTTIKNVALRIVTLSVIIKMHHSVSSIVILSVAFA